MPKNIVQISIASLLFIISLFSSFENIWIHNTLYIISYLLVGAEIVWKAIKKIVKGDVFDESVLLLLENFLKQLLLCYFIK